MALRSIRDSAREVVLIVLGVVIAFGVDARWEDVLERRTEVRVLRSIQSEMAENQLRLDRAIQVRISANEAAEALLGMTGPEAPPQLMSVVDSLLRAVDRGVATYDPVTGSTDALILGGQLSSISSDSLRLALASWPEQLRDLREDEVWLIQYSYVEGGPVSIQGRLLGSRGPGWAAAPGEYTPPELLRNPDFARRIEIHIGSFMQILRAAEALKVGIARLAEVLESELGG